MQEEIHYYMSGLLAFGQGFVIVSTGQLDEKNLYAETYIIFESALPNPIFFPFRIKYPIYGESPMQNLIKFAENKVIGDLQFDILYGNFREKIEERGILLSVDLNKEDSGLLTLLRYKFPDELSRIQASTKNEKLKSMISLVQSVTVTEIK